MMDVKLAHTFLSDGQPLHLLASVVLLALVPMALLSVSAFVKVTVVLGILRNAIGAQQVPSGAVVTVLALVISLYVLRPVALECLWEFENARPAPLSGSDRGKEASVLRTLERLRAASGPLARFLARHSGERERIFFASAGHAATEGGNAIVCPFGPARRGEAPPDCAPSHEDLGTLVPAFLLTELREAFAIGFSVFLPFLVVDLLVANILLGLGMSMMNPVTVSLPFKLVLFVMCDGWLLIARGLIEAYS